MKLDIITKQVVNLTKTVGQFIKSEVDKLDKSDIEEKGIHNLVTYVDKESEK
ncbi:MAG: inositol monophosphatase, partial [Bacteroidetes bacterium]|nr:inositol monophosphatase [Bacteroidota bacterium]